MLLNFISVILAKFSFEASFQKFIVGGFCGKILTQIVDLLIHRFDLCFGVLCLLPCMQRLGMWASVYDCAIVLIGHLNKKEGTKGLYRSLGSIDVVAAARSVLQVERDQKDTDIRIVRQIKNSLAPSDGEIRFSITAEMGFQWLECKSTFVSSEQPKVPEFESKTEKAAYLIKKLLSDGDMRAREIYMRMKDEGISRRTAENTKKELGIRSYRKMRQWYWSIHTGE